SDDNLRKFCTGGIEDDCKKFADNFLLREELRKKDGDLCAQDYYGRTHAEDCKHAAEQRKLDQEMVDKYLSRLEAKRAAKTLELCDKHVFDTAYCAAFKQKLQSKVHPAGASSQSTSPTNRH